MSLAAFNSDNDFALFGVPQTFAQDTELLAQRWRLLQAQVHPDKFVTQGAAAQRQAMQWSMRINEAYQRLKQPISRASYLCQLHAVVIDVERNTAMPVEFLMQQLEWREAIDDASNLAELEQLKQQVQTEQQQRLQQLELALDQQQDYQAAAEQVRILMFLRQFFREFDKRQLQLQTDIPS